MATHSSILAWKILWTEEPGGLLSIGLQESDTIEQLNHQYDKHWQICQKSKALWGLQEYFKSAKGPEIKTLRITDLIIQ